MQIEYGKVYGAIVAVLAMGVSNLLGAQAVAVLAVGLGPANFKLAFGAMREGQVDHLVVYGIASDDQRLGWRLVVRYVEQGAVGHDPLARVIANLPNARNS